MKHLCPASVPVIEKITERSVFCAAQGGFQPSSRDLHHAIDRVFVLARFGLKLRSLLTQVQMRAPNRKLMRLRMQWKLSICPRRLQDVYDLLEL
jgi:hypothetical protein